MKILNNITLKYLKLNKKRTLVTIIGIILSGAMLSAVTTLGVSFQNFMINAEKKNGDYEAVLRNVQYSNLKYIENNNQISDSFIISNSNIYMAENPYSNEEYLRIDQYDEESISKLGEELINGSFPKNSDEIALSYTFFDDKENEPKIGDTITWNVGYFEDAPDNEYGIKFIQTGTKTYKITGKIKRPSFETYDEYLTAGITIMDKSTLSDKTLVNVGITTKNPKNVYKITEELANYVGTDSIKYNRTLLAYEGVSDDLGFSAMLNSVSTILIIIIMTGSIMVIYNSFAISVSERKKQIGMLASVGATKKQIRKSVIFEAFVLGIIGIPLGILCGILGIGITLRIVNNLLSSIISNYTWNLELVLSWKAMGFSAVLMAVTIFISAIIPAIKASRITPIEAIRQSQDIKVKSKKLRTPKFINKLFGIEGTIALKNLKRAKKRYRTTVISLVVSVALYISVSGFTQYMFTGFDTVYSTKDYDYSVSMSSNKNLINEENTVINQIEKMDGVKKSSYISSFGEYTIFGKNELENNIIDVMENMGDSSKTDDGNYYVTAAIVKVEGEEYNNYLEKIGLKEIKDGEAVLINKANLIMSYNVETDIVKSKTGDDIKVMQMREDGSEEISNLKIAKLTDKTPMGLEIVDNGYINLIIIVNDKTYNELLNKQVGYSQTKRVYLKTTDDTKSIDNQLKEIRENNANVSINCVNCKEAMEQNRNINIIINIFLYGFVALISAIGISNIFNTISTNVTLRRREFANLKSIGMTDKQFNRMLNLECIFYGTKALIFGLPLGIALCYAINTAFKSGVGFMFKIPWTSVLISCIAVYIVVFITMLYSSSKIKKEKIIETLRDDNI